MKKRTIQEDLSEDEESSSEEEASFDGNESSDGGSFQGDESSDGGSFQGDESSKEGDDKSESSKSLAEDDNVSIDSEEHLQQKIDTMKAKKKSSRTEEQFEEELKAISADLAVGRARLKEGSTLTMRHLFALAKSKGCKNPPKPSKGKKPKLELIWKKSQNKNDWIRTAFFNDSDQKELDAMVKLLMEV